MLDAAGATHVSQSLRHWGAPLSPWPDIADEMIPPSFTDITDQLMSMSLTAQCRPYAWEGKVKIKGFVLDVTVLVVPQVDSWSLWTCGSLSM